MTAKKDLRTILKSLTGQRINNTEIAEKVGEHRNTVSRKMASPDANDVIAFARACGANPVCALVDMDLITHSEVHEHFNSDGTMLATATPEQLVERLAAEMLDSEVLRQIADSID